MSLGGIPISDPLIARLRAEELTDDDNDYPDTCNECGDEKDYCRCGELCPVCHVARCICFMDEGPDDPPRVELGPFTEDEVSEAIATDFGRTYFFTQTYDEYCREAYACLDKAKDWFVSPDRPIDDLSEKVSSLIKMGLDEAEDFVYAATSDFGWASYDVRTRMVNQMLGYQRMRELFK